MVLLWEPLLSRPKFAPLHKIRKLTLNRPELEINLAPGHWFLFSPAFTYYGWTCSLGLPRTSLKSHKLAKMVTNLYWRFSGTCFLCILLDYNSNMSPTAHLFCFKNFYISSLFVALAHIRGVAQTFAAWPFYNDPFWLGKPAPRIWKCSRLPSNFKLLINQLVQCLSFHALPLRILLARHQTMISYAPRLSTAIKILSLYPLLFIGPVPNGISDLKPKVLADWNWHHRK